MQIFAVCHGSKGNSRHNKRECEVIHVDSDHEELITKRMKDELYSTVLSLDYKVEEMKEDIDTVKDAVQEILHLNSRAKLPIGL